MEIILREKIDKLGDEGQVVKVRPGYARNFLIPKGLAFPANTANASQIEHRKKMALDQRRRQVKTDEDLARALSEVSVAIPARVGEEERIFGSVTSKNISDALMAKGFKVDRRKIQVDPIRSLGEYTATVRLSGEISADLKVNVIEQK